MAGNSDADVQALRPALAAIEESDFPDDLLEVFTEREERAFAEEAFPSVAGTAESAAASPAPRKPGAGGVLPPPVRSAAAMAMAQLCGMLRLPSATSMQAVTLLDVYCHRACSTNEMELLPGTCAAICSLLSKLDSARATPSVPLLQAAADWLQKWLVSVGLVGPAEPFVNFDAHELRVLKVLQWHINVPSVELWLSAFCSRLNVATKGAIKASVDWILQQGIELARVVLLTSSAFVLPPRKFAMGLLCHGLMAAHLLPLDTFHAEQDISRAEWEQAVKTIPWQSELRCTLPPRAQQTVFESLQLATGVDAAALRGLAFRFSAAAAASAASSASPSPTLPPGRSREA